MSKVTFRHRGGREQVMHEKFARVLQSLGRGTYGDEATAKAIEPKKEEAKASKAARELAEAAGVDLEKVVGTGNDGAITKPDVEAFIAALNPQE
ncbi:E3 binding domain-containing protein [Pseudomonas sp. MDMC_285]|nr:E3 binding domain-containing protein [Pseudomonas sp. MDMC_285]